MPKRVIDHETAKNLAKAIIDVLSPHCERIEVAGSLRRNQAQVGDIELVAISKTHPVGLFGQDVTHAAVERIRQAADQESPDIRILASGGRAVQFVILRQQVQVDLYLATPDNWGYIFAIRTGPAHFSKRAVTPTSKGGFLTEGHRCADGYVWERHRPGGTSLEPQRKLDDGAWYSMLRVPEEQDFFKLLTCGWIDPPRR